RPSPGTKSCNAQRPTSANTSKVNFIQTAPCGVSILRGANSILKLGILLDNFCGVDRTALITAKVLLVQNPQIMELFITSWRRRHASKLARRFDSGTTRVPNSSRDRDRSLRLWPAS